jgi:hypothetical protein
MLNLDDYFWSLVEHPTDWINDRNFEAPEAMDIQLLNEQLRLLLDGKTVEKPVFDFRKHFCHAAVMETLSCGFRLRANARGDQKRFPIQVRHAVVIRSTVASQ